jgi:hypothetical protein
MRQGELSQFNPHNPTRRTIFPQEKSAYRLSALCHGRAKVIRRWLKEGDRFIV